VPTIKLHAHSGELPAPESNHFTMAKNRVGEELEKVVGIGHENERHFVRLWDYKLSTASNSTKPLNSNLSWSYTPTVLVPNYNCVLF
jgi:hypothetical protein